MQMVKIGINYELKSFKMSDGYDVNVPFQYTCPNISCEKCNCNVGCICPPCKNTVIQDIALLCAQRTKNLNKNTNQLWIELKQNALYIGLGTVAIYILGIISVFVFLTVRKRCTNGKPQEWF